MAMKGSVDSEIVKLVESISMAKSNSQHLDKLSEACLARMKASQVGAEKIVKAAKSYHAHLQQMVESEQHFLEVLLDTASISTEVEGDTGVLASGLQEVVEGLQFLNVLHNETADTLQKEIVESLGPLTAEWKKGSQTASSRLHKGGTVAMKDLRRAEQKSVRGRKKDRVGSKEDLSLTLEKSYSLEELQQKFAGTLLTEERARLCTLADMVFLLGDAAVANIDPNLERALRKCDGLTSNPGALPSNPEYNLLLSKSGSGFLVQDRVGASVQDGSSLAASGISVSHSMRMAPASEYGSEDGGPPPLPPPPAEMLCGDLPPPPPPPPPPVPAQPIHPEFAAARSLSNVLYSDESVRRSSLAGESHHRQSYVGQHGSVHVDPTTLHAFAPDSTLELSGEHRQQSLTHIPRETTAIDALAHVIAQKDSQQHQQRTAL